MVSTLRWDKITYTKEASLVTLLGGTKVRPLYTQVTYARLHRDDMLALRLSRKSASQILTPKFLEFCEAPKSSDCDQHCQCQPVAQLNL